MIDMLADGAFKLAELIADKISKETGVDKKITFPLAMEAARQWVDAERKAVTDARAKAVKRVRGR